MWTGTVIFVLNKLLFVVLMSQIIIYWRVFFACTMMSKTICVLMQSAMLIIEWIVEKGQ
jgi:hypothetical protein